MKLIANNTEFEQFINSDRPVLLKFYANWCSDCKALQFVLEDLSETYEGKIEFVKIDVEAHQDLAEEYHVRSIPAMFFIKNSKIVDQAKGVRPKAELMKKLNQLLT